MKIAVKDTDNFISNIPSTIKSILLYGPDSGITSIRANSIAKSHDIIAKYNFEQIKNNPFVLLDKFNSIGLFNNNSSKKKIIIIECSNTSINESYSNFLESTDFNGLIIFCAKDLGVDSSLRRYFEKNTSLAAIPSYHDDASSISKIIQQSFRNNKISYTSEVIPVLMNYITIGDRLLIINEIEKICLYFYEKKQISIDDLHQYLEQQSDVTFDKLCYKISLKQKNDIESYLLKLQNEGHNAVALIRMISRHFFRIYQAKHLIIQQNKTEQQAMESLSPPVFFKQVNDFSRSLKLWNIQDLQNFLEKLTYAELEVKKNSTTASLTLQNALLDIRM